MNLEKIVNYADKSLSDVIDFVGEKIIMPLLLIIVSPIWLPVYLLRKIRRTK